MKCAILGNGPSHKLYDSSKEYDTVIGCNIPWTTVDWTCIMDADVINAWQKNPDLITVPIYIATRVHDYACSLNMGMNVYGTFTLKRPEPETNYSSGHYAALKAIELGHTQIDLYGFDSYYTGSIESITRKHVLDNPANNAIKWRNLWNRIISSNQDVVFNFIKE